jgi:hypothetical protein
MNPIRPWNPAPLGNQLIAQHPRYVALSNRTTTLYEACDPLGGVIRVYDSFGLDLSINQMVKVGDCWFKINCIEKTLHHSDSGTYPSYQFAFVPFNPVEQMIMPLAALWHFSSFKPHGYVASFLADDFQHTFHPEQRKLLLLMRKNWPGLKGHDFSDFYLKQNIHHEPFDDWHDLYVFPIQERFFHDYDLLLAGQYSRVSSIGKSLILQYNQAGQSSHLQRVLFPDRKQLDQLERTIGLMQGTLMDHAEVASPPELEACILKESYKMAELPTDNLGLATAFGAEQQP